LAGCGGGDSAEPLSFALASSEERSALVFEASGGAELFFALAAILSDGDEVCPRVVDSGTTRTVRGGCTADDGTRWSGSLVVSNLVGSRDPAKPTTFAFSDFGQAALMVDGSLSVTSTKLTSQVKVSGDLPTMNVDVTWEPSGEATRVGADSSIELVGNGSAAVSGQWDTSVPTGALELRGKELLRIDFGRSDGNGCAPATLDGAAVGSYCPGESSLVAHGREVASFALRSAWRADPMRSGELSRDLPRRLSARVAVRRQ
jgi:hypothetical protein